MATTEKKEGIQWILTIANTLYNAFETISGIHDKLPESIKQKLPGFLGLSLADEQIFNSVLGQIKDVKKQVVITNFLEKKCKDYERNRFINIVAGMDVIEEGKTEEKKDSFDDNGKKVTATKIKSGGKSDTRKQFLESFADIITNEFDGDLDKAYDYCIGGRMIIPDPLHQKVLRAFSESVGWFKKIVLDTFGATSVEDLLQKAKEGFSKNSADLESSTMSLREKAKSYRQKYEGRK